MLIFTVVVLIIVILAVTYVFLVMPRVADGADMDMQSADYARCGLHSNGVPRDSLPAFLAARELGYGIEIVLRMTADGEILVLGDETLLRSRGIKKRVSSMRAADIRSATEDSVPTLKQVLELIDGHVPLLLEIKHAPNAQELCQRLCVMMDGYGGAFAIESEARNVLAFFRKYRPRYARGQILSRSLSSNSKGAKKEKRSFESFATRHLFTNLLTRPDFITIDGSLIKEPAFLIATKLFGRVGFVRTVRTERQYEFCRSRGLYAIFENIIP